MAVEEVTFQIGLPIIVGLIIGIIEAYFVYEDENMTSGKDFLKDMWHGLLFCVLGVLIATNVPWLLAQGWVPEWVNGLLFIDGSTGISFVVCLLVSLFMMVKMVASHAIRGVSGNGFKEKFWHKVVIALLVGFSPYYILAIAPILEPITSKLPDWVV